jgi:hypothetical protein
MFGSDQVPNPDDYTEPLVEVAVREFKDRATRFTLQFRPQVWRTWGLREEASKRQKASAMERSSTELRFASFLASLCGLEGLSRVKMNAQKAGALDSPSKPKGEVCFIFCLTRPTTS